MKRHKVPNGKRGKGKDDEEEPRTELSYVANLRRTSPSVKAAEPPLFRKSGELESQWARHGDGLMFPPNFESTRGESFRGRAEASS